jgi:hypothetical protein
MFKNRHIYASPRVVTDITQCYFYHTIDLPEIGTVEGNWDLRAGLHEYLGNFDFRGKRVLDIGTANGILSFWMEKHGAEVISFDLDKEGDWDMVPFANWPEYEQISNDRKTIIDRLNNAYWFCHRLPSLMHRLSMAMFMTFQRDRVCRCFGIWLYTVSSS